MCRISRVCVTSHSGAGSALLCRIVRGRNGCHGHPRILRTLIEQASRFAVTSRAFHTDRLGPFLAGLCALTGLDGAVMLVSAFVVSRDVSDIFVPGNHGSTFGGDPLAAAVGLTVLEEEGLVLCSAERGQHMRDRLTAPSLAAIRAVRARGLWLGVEIDPGFASAWPICSGG